MDPFRKLKISIGSLTFYLSPCDVGNMSLQLILDVL